MKHRPNLSGTAGPLLLGGMIIVSIACRQERKDPFAEAEKRQPPPAISTAPAVATPEPSNYDERRTAIDSAMMLKDVETANKLWPKVLEDIEGFGIKDPRYLITLNEAAYHYYFNGGMDTAEQLFRKMIEVRKQVDGPDGIEVANEILKVANLCGFNSRNDEAEVFYKQALEVVNKNPKDEKFVEVKRRVLTDYAATLSRVEGRKADADALTAQAAEVK